MKIVHDMAKTKTVLLISHRLENVVSSDNIFLLSNASVAESDTHDELMKLGGEYYTMFNNQAVLEKYSKEDA